MRKLLIAAWLMLPVAGLAYHLGPGQDRLHLDDAGAKLAEGAALVERAQALALDEGDLAARSAWAQADIAYEEALALLPSEALDLQRHARLERAKCRMQISELPEANGDLAQLVEELGQDERSDPALLRDARRTLANSEYYMTWLMRLEGLGRDEWGPRIDAARQTFKLLAEDAGTPSAEKHAVQEDLEAAIRLARIDLTELQGLPLPSV